MTLWNQLAAYFVLVGPALMLVAAAQLVRWVVR